MIYIRVCVVCGKEFQSTGPRGKYCPVCRPEAKKKLDHARQRRYRESEHGQKAIRQWREEYVASGRKKAWDEEAKANGKAEQYRNTWRSRHPEEQRRINHACGKRYRERYPEREKARKERYAMTHKERLQAYWRLRQAVRRNVPGAKIKLAEFIGKKTYCERMRLRAYPLPCGQRDECRGCQHCPADATFGVELRRQHFFDMDYIGGR